MKKYIFCIGIVTLLLISAIFYVYERGVKEGNNTGLMGTKVESAADRKINENIEKYHPKDTDEAVSSGLDLSAKSTILINENTGKVLYAKDIHAKLPPASITKVATLAVVLENLKKDQLVSISDKAADQEPNKIVMKVGEKLMVSDLLAGLMMISANDAAWALAESVPGGFDSFIGLMNKKARDLGLSDSNFTNPAGFDDPKHLTSVYDIATFVRYDLVNHPEFVKYTGYKGDYSVFATDHNESHWWSHISHMLYAYPGMIAAKTGYTDIAKSTFAGVADRGGKRLTVVFMGSTDANGDVKKILDYGFSVK